MPSTEKPCAMKAQVSVEMLMVYSVLVLAFVLSFSVIGGQTQSILYAKNSMSAFQMASSLGSVMDSVFIGGDGTTAIVDVGQKNAEILVQGRMLRVIVGNSPYEWSLLTNSTNSSGFSQTHPVNDINRSLLAFWTFDRVNGTTIYDDATYGANCTRFGGASSAPGKFSNGFYFNGTNGYLTCPNTPSLNLTQEISVEAWIKLNQTGIDQKILGKQSGSSGGYKFGIYTNNKVEFEIRNTANAQFLNRAVAGGTTLAAGQWYYVVGVYSRSGNYIKTYVNGVLDRTLSPVGAVLAPTTTGLVIGREPFGNQYYFSGTMDDVLVWNRVLSEAEINASYNSFNYSSGSVVPGTIRVSNLNGVISIENI